MIREPLERLMKNWMELGEESVAGAAISRGEALSVLQSPDDELLAVMQAAFIPRQRHFGRAVNLHVLRNAKSGMCSENCAFCSQSVMAESGVERYRMQSVDEIVEGARDARSIGAVKYCIVTSTRSPSDLELQTVCDAVRRIKKEVPLHLCASLGLLNAAQAEVLAAAGVNRYNHNLETSRRFFPTICQTHTFEERVATVKAAKAAGMEACCGGIVGLGETLEDRTDWAFALRELEVEAIPVNFFDPRPGTALSAVPRLKPAECLRALAMVRLVNPSRDIRVAGGREVNLRSLQPLALYAANSIFTNGYLTTPGQGYSADLAMLGDAGFTVGKLEA